MASSTCSFRVAPLSTDLNIQPAGTCCAGGLPPMGFFLLMMVTGLSLFLTTASHAQTFGITSSLMHDDNIFDNYTPVPGNILQFQLDCSKDWEIGRLSLTGNYSGAGLIFRDLTSRNYHAHSLSLSGLFQVENHDDDEDEPESDDSTESAAPPAAPVQPNDSLDHFIEGGIDGGGQFDRQEYDVYDSRRIGGSLIFRQPLGTVATLRPAWSVTFNAYPNLQGLGNLQNSFSMNVGSSLFAGSWFSVAYTWSIKSYPQTSTYLLTFTADTTIVVHTHGKPVITHETVTRHRLERLNSPTVRQSVFSVLLKQALTPGTSLMSTYTIRMEPSAEARVIPELGHGAGVLGIEGVSGDIFDDPFSYSADEYQIQATQALPLAFSLTVSGEFAGKRYSYNASDLQDSTLNVQRIDRRTIISAGLSRSFKWKSGTAVTAQFGYQFLRNESNSAYYEFDKHVVTASLQVLF
jgi:hypothetical protein